MSKGIIGAVRCDADKCVQIFVSMQIDEGHVNPLHTSDRAEREAEKEGWSIDRRGRARHYCPAHTLQRSEASKPKNKYANRIPKQ